MQIGLYFGSFNPVHHGHLIIASHIAGHTNLDQIWFIVSPQNPFKVSHSLLNEYQRLHLVRIAIEGESKLRASDIEFHLPRPSYTIDTLTYLGEKYPQHQFAIAHSIQRIKIAHVFVPVGNAARYFRPPSFIKGSGLVEILLPLQNTFSHIHVAGTTGMMNK